MLETGREAVQGFLNSKNRSTGHVLTGAVLCVGVVAASALIATLNSPTKANPKITRQYDRLEQPALQPPKEAFALVWPPLFGVMAISGLRIWNAPDGPRRTRALGFWAAIQGLNALWMAWGPKHRLQQLFTAVTTLGATAAYAHQAAKVDGKAAAMVAPYAGWISFANLLTEELWRKNRPGGATIH
jgi:benzodiazapine receptor